MKVMSGFKEGQSVFLLTTGEIVIVIIVKEMFNKDVYGLAILAPHSCF